MTDETTDEATTTAADAAEEQQAEESTPPPREADESAPVFLVLQEGSEGDQVARLQQYLNVPVTRIFDERTLASVINYQARLGIPENGVVDAVMWAALGQRIILGSHLGL